MQFKIIRVVIIIYGIMNSQYSCSQELRYDDLKNNKLISVLQSDKEPAYNPVKLHNLLASFNQFEVLKTTTSQFNYIYDDVNFGSIKIKVYIPENYNPQKHYPAILLLHGAVGTSNDPNYTGDQNSDDDVFFNYLKGKGYVIIRPYANSLKKFDWVVNRTFRKPNPTFITLNNIISELKSFLNLDDNHVIAFGHSDGSDGAFGLQVLAPGNFSGFVMYNSMLNNLRDDNIFPQNTVNRPMFVVHSDLDALRPIEQMRIIFKLLKLYGTKIEYKEYIGYKHYDKHLAMDSTRSLKFLSEVKRKIWPDSIAFHTNNILYGECDWLKVTQLGMGKIDSTAYVKTYMSKTKIYDNYPYYPLKESNSIIGVYKNNVFTLKGLGVKAFELFIDPNYVDMNKPVTVSYNNKQVFYGKVEYDRKFTLDNFKLKHDRSRVYVNSIKINE